MDAVLGPYSNPDEKLTELVDLYQTALLHMCNMYLRDRAMAEDAVQETFLRAYKSLPTFRGECSEKTWLMHIAVNICRDMTKSAWFRHTDRRIVPEDVESFVQKGTPQENDGALAEEIAALPRKYKDVILLYYYQNMTLTEVAQALKTAPSTVSRRLNLARKKLREVLERGQADEQE